MERNREQRRTAGRGARRRRQLVAGGVAVATTAVVGGWGVPAHAGTVAPSASAVCIVDDEEPLGSNRVSGRLADFQPSQPFHSLIIMKGPRNDKTFQFVIDFETPTEADGTYTTPGGTALGVPYTGLPVEVSWTVYRDTNGNGRWDSTTDDTVYQGAGDVTACPQTVTLSSK